MRENIWFIATFTSVERAVGFSKWHVVDNGCLRFLPHGACDIRGPV